MLQFMYGVVLWVIVPCIIVGMFIFAMIICSHADEKRSAWSGFLLGLILFVLYIISKLSELQSINFAFNSFPKFGFGSWVTLILGGVVGFALLFIVRVLIPTRGIGIVCLILTSASTCSLFSYIFVENIRDTAMFLALGTLCGLLVHVMFIPETLPEIFR